MPLITISRGIGCGGMIIARLVADGLHLPLYDNDLLQKEAVRSGYRAEEMAGLDEKAPGFLDLMFSQRPRLFLDYMESLIYGVARKGEGVIIGHGSQMLLREFGCALHVHVYANESRRIQNLMTHRGLDKEVARRLIRKSDDEQQGFFRFAFHMNWTDPSLYDLIINTEQLGIDTAAHLIMEAARSDGIKACSVTALDAMERLSLKKKIEAALLKNNVSVVRFIIDVPSAGEVDIRGYSSSADEVAMVLAIIKAVKGVSKVKEDIYLGSAFE